MLRSQLNVRYRFFDAVVMPAALEVPHGALQLVNLGLNLRRHLGTQRVDALERARGVEEPLELLREEVHLVLEVFVVVAVVDLVEDGLRGDEILRPGVSVNLRLKNTCRHNNCPYVTLTEINARN